MREFDLSLRSSSFSFIETSTPEIYTLSLHDALPICEYEGSVPPLQPARARDPDGRDVDRTSTRLNSSHLGISYAVFCLKKKELLLLFYELNKSGLLAENEKIPPILSELEKL